MGKFDGVLLISDYDQTFGLGNDIPKENLEMLAYFEREGGRFTIATGRAHHTFRIIRPNIPFNAPVLLANGAVVYDFDKEEALWEEPLPDTVREDMAELARLHPEMSLEVYSGEDDIYVWNTNKYVEHHITYTGASSHPCAVAEMPFPWDKAIMEQERDILENLQKEILARWGDRYEAIFSAHHMLELNAKGCTKGTAALRLAERLGIDRKNLYCVGDNENDIAMLEVSAIPFAPANAIPAIQSFPNVVMLPKCTDGAIAALIRHLDKIYG